MWQVISGWFGSFFNYVRPQRADFEAAAKTQNEVIAHQNAVITSMQGRIDTMDTEFRKTMERHDKDMERRDKRIDALERAEATCRGQLSKVERQLDAALRQNAELTDKVRTLVQANEAAERIRALTEDEGYKRDTIAHSKTLLEIEDRTNRGGGDENPTG